MRGAYRLCLLLGFNFQARGYTAVPHTRTLTIPIEGLVEPVQALEVLDSDALLDCTELATDECDIYGACLWPSSYVAARALVRRLRSSTSPSSARVVEIGCGAAALPSLAALAAGAGEVVATDWSPLALRVVEDATARFQPGRADRLRAERFDVRDAERRGGLPWRCDVLVCADMLYDPQAARAVGVCAALAVAQGAAAIVCDPGRLDGAGRVHFFDGVRSVAGDAPWARRLAFVDESVRQEVLNGFGASLSWCGEQETAVGLVELSRD